MKAAVHLEIHQNAQEPLRVWFTRFPREIRPAIRLSIKYYLQKIAPQSVNRGEPAKMFEWEYEQATFRYSVRWMKKRSWLLWTNWVATVVLLDIIPHS